MQNKLVNIAADLFIGSVIILTAVSVLGVWDFFSGDVIRKSFETLGVLAVVAIVIIVASNYIGEPGAIEGLTVQNPEFRPVRNFTLSILIVSAVLLAFLGVLSIWNVITDATTLHKSLSTLSIVAFAALIIVMVCLQREQNPFWQKRGREMTGSAVLLGFILLALLFTIGW